MSVAALADDAPEINWRNLIWVALCLGAMVAAIASDDPYFLNFVHVLTGLLWTGIDLFMGFVIGPILRRVDPPVRRAIALRLMPRTLFIMPTLAIIAPTTGWYLAELYGFTDLAWPDYGWMAAAPHPPPGDPGPSGEDMFGDSVYLRGGLTLHALRVEIGDEATWEILRVWADRYAYGNGTTDDFVGLVEEISGRRLDDLFHAWLFDPAMPPLPG